MKQVIHSAEWLAESRKRAGLSQAELAKLAGIAHRTICSIEQGVRNGSPRIWAKTDKVLRPLAPVMYVNEEELILDARAYQRLAGEDSLCRLYYVMDAWGMTCTNVCPVEKELDAGSCITVSWADALKLLEGQKSLFD